MTFSEVFKEMKPVIGMINTGSNAEIAMLDLAKKEIGIYLKYGVVPLIENYFGSDEDCADVLSWMHKEHPDSIYGVNILGDYYEMVEALKKDKFLCLSIRQRQLSDPTFGHLQSKRSSWD